MKVHRPTAPGHFPVLPDGTHTVALGNASQFEIHLQRHAGGGELFVGVIGFGCYAFNFPPHPSYAAAKLRLEPGDAENLADLIACQFGPPPAQPAGHYNPRLLAREPAESGKPEGRNAADFDLFIANHWPAGLPKDCTRLGSGQMDCLLQEDRQSPPCESCITWSLLGAQWEEHKLTQRNTAAAVAFLRSEAALMGTPLTPEQERQASLGPLLDAAHEEVHRLLKLPA